MSAASRSNAISKANRESGLHFALSRGGLRLPLIDITHPAFALDPSPEELEEIVAAALGDLERQSGAPDPALGAALRDSVLASGIARSRGGYLSGLATYMLKLGPDNLGEDWAKDIDRKIAGSLPCFSARLRLQATARLLAEDLAPRLAAEPGKKLRLLNIAGGCAADSFNALLALRDSHAALEDRPIEILVLDIDEEGPAFGREAIEVLGATGSPLEGLRVGYSHLVYDWSSASATQTLARALPDEGAILVASSEGGLFEYGSDEEILRVLRTFGEGSGSQAAFVGSLSLLEGTAGRFNQGSGAAIRLWRLGEFARLVEGAGWKIDGEVECPLSLVVRLRKA
jgi:hypothetical protein